MKIRYLILAGAASFFASIACGFQAQIETKREAPAQDNSTKPASCTFENVREGSSFFCANVYKCFICEYEGTGTYECRPFDASRCF